MIISRLASTALVLLPILACAPAAGHSRVTGRVVDHLDSHPVRGARLQVRGTDFAVETDSLGAFHIGALPLTGCARVLVRAIGYAWTEVRVDMDGPAEQALGPIPLRPAPVSEWPLLLIPGCDAGSITPDEAPWGVDTLLAP